MSNRQPQGPKTPKQLYEIEFLPLLGELQSPIAITSSPVNSNDVFVAEQRGQIYRYDLKSKSKITFLDLSKNLPKMGSDYDERGLLSLVLHPEFGSAKSKFRDTFFIFYSIRKDVYEASPSYVLDPVKSGFKPEDVYYNCVSSFSAIRSDGKADGKTEKVILSIEKKLDIHNGGKMIFGPDGFLYIALGDGGPQKDTFNKSQNLQTWYGKVLRIDVDRPQGERGYSIPSSNPFADGKKGRAEIFAYGFRNPWGMCFDPMNRLLLGDVGYNTLEELNSVISGGNYGWNLKEGTIVTPWTSKKDLPEDLIDPVFTYPTPDPLGAIISGFALWSRNGKNVWYIGGDVSGSVFLLEDGKTKQWTSVAIVSVAHTGESHRRVKSFGQLSDGTICVMTSAELGPTGKTGEISAVRIS